MIAVIVLIPAYEPDHRLLDLIDALGAGPDAPHIVVVDDGSGPAYAATFAQAWARGTTVLAHRANLGKGRALRTGLEHIRSAHPGQDVVAADSDGQHLPVDIRRVGERVRREGDALVLGARAFVGRVPRRSRIGNEATRWAVRLACELSLRDTQTGLRGYPAGLIGLLLAVPGDRFEWEMSALLEAHSRGVRIVEVPIATVYHDGNAGTHFRPIADSARVYAPVLRFAGSSLAAAALDLMGLVLLMWTTGNLLVSVVGARLASGAVNFAVNRRLVFRQPRDAPLSRAAARYAALAWVLLAANYVLMWLLTSAGLGLLLAKLATEGSLYVASFVAQQRLVFAGGRGLGAGPAPARAPAVDSCGSDVPAGAGAGPG